MTRPVDAAPFAFTRTEQRALQALRRRYREGCDLFTSRELVRLQFLRWLYRTGHFLPPAGGESDGPIKEVAA